MTSLRGGRGSVEQAPELGRNTPTGEDASAHQIGAGGLSRHYEPAFASDEGLAPAEQIEWEAMLCLLRINPLSAHEGR